MPIEPEPPPFLSTVNAIVYPSDKSLKSILQRQVCGLYDTGADDNTTNNPFVLHELALLPRNRWSRLHDAGHIFPSSVALHIFVIKMGLF